MTTPFNTFGVSEETFSGYLWLLNSANYSGVVCRSLSALTRDLKRSKKSLISLLQELETAKLIEIKNPLPFLVLRLPLWSGKRPRSKSRTPSDEPIFRPSARAASALPLYVYPSSSSRAAADLENFRGGVQGEGNLADLVSAATGWSDRAEIEALLAAHDPPVVRRALTRLAQVPDSQIRTSRVAYFRFLLRQFSKSSSNHHETFTTHPDPRHPPAPSSRGPAP